MSVTLRVCRCSIANGDTYTGTWLLQWHARTSQGLTSAWLQVCAVHLSRPISNSETLPGLGLSVVLTPTPGRKATSFVWICAALVRLCLQENSAPAPQSHVKVA